MGDKMISPTELADMLNVSVRTVYTWKSNGTGPRAIKVGKHIRYRTSDVEQWLEGLAVA